MFLTNRLYKFTAPKNDLSSEMFVGARIDAMVFSFSGSGRMP